MIFKPLWFRFNAGDRILFFFFVAFSNPAFGVRDFFKALSAVWSRIYNSNDGKEAVNSMVHESNPGIPFKSALLFPTWV